MWRADVPGRGWSSPVVWGEQIFLTAVLNDQDAAAAPGIYSGPPDRLLPGEHVWKLYCLDFDTGNRSGKTATRGTGGILHLKNTYASETPVTDGEHVYVYFGNLGLYCYDAEETLAWSKSLGPIKHAWAGARGHRRSCTRRRSSWSTTTRKSRF